jgi:hypothetical protein
VPCGPQDPDACPGDVLVCEQPHYVGSGLPGAVLSLPRISAA